MHSIKRRGMLCLLVAILLMLGTNSYSFAVEKKSAEKATLSEKPNGAMSFNEPTEEEKKQAVEEFLRQIDITPNTTLKSSLNKSWHYNTGKKCPKVPKYDKYNLLEIVEPGDIIFEAAGGFGITGHIAIVEGIFVDEGKRYIRVIEAIDEGVCRSVFDDDRFIDKKATILTAPNNVNKAKVIHFCIEQLGKNYSISDSKHPSTDINTESWYCSELVWAAYQYVGYDIEYKHDLEFINNGLDEFINEIAISPTEIALGGASRNTTSYRLVYEKQLVKYDNNAYVMIKWVPLPFVRGYRFYVEYTERNPNRLYCLDKEGFIIPPCSNEDMETDYSLVQYANFNENELFKFHCSVNNRWHNGEFPLPVLNQARSMISESYNVYFTKNDIGLTGEVKDGNFDDGVTLFFDCELSWEKNNSNDRILIYDKNKMPIAITDKRQVVVTSKELAEGYLGETTFYVAVISKNGYSCKIPIIITTPQIIV